MTANFRSMPKCFDFYNGSHERCDALVGPCACGAWHEEGDWTEKINELYSRHSEETATLIRKEFRVALAK